MSITKGKLIAVGALAALGSVAAIAVTSLPDSGAGAAASPALDAERTKLKPRVKREVVHRTRHVRAAGTSSAPGGSAARLTASPSAVAPAVTPVAAGDAGNPGGARGSSPAAPEQSGGYEQDDSDQDDAYEDDAYEDDHAGPEDQHESDDEHEVEHEDEDLGDD